ncbi:MAG: hypothetical protein ACI909_003557 [Planctomycetota bacterium]|jgi:hypothetical protein
MPIEENLRTHINLLCAENRKPHTKGHEEAQSYISDSVRAMGYQIQRQDFRAIPYGLCRNLYVETGPENGNRFIIGGHYDALGRSGPAADDNASAVAILLELISHAPADIPLTFVFFDYEEDIGFFGRKGSQAFVKTYPKPMCGAPVLDLVGGSFMPGFDQSFFQFGTAMETLRHNNLEFFHMPMKFIEPIGKCAPRSDYASFRSRGIPFTFISSGTPWYYHSQNDTPDILHFDKMMHLTESIINTWGIQPIAAQPHVDWKQLPEIARRISVIPALNDRYFRRMAASTRKPGSLSILKLYFKVIPKLKKLGPDLWT